MSVALQAGWLQLIFVGLVGRGRWVILRVVGGTVAEPATVIVERRSNPDRHPGRIYQCVRNHGMTFEQQTKPARPGTCPHLGAQFQPLQGEQLADPYPFYARARREEPIFYSSTFGMWFLTRYEDIIEVLKDPVTFSSAGTIPPPG